MVGGLDPVLCSTLMTSRAVAPQAPQSMGFPRQEYWSGLLYPSPGDLSDPGIESLSPALACDYWIKVLRKILKHQEFDRHREESRTW